MPIFILVTIVAFMSHEVCTLKFTRESHQPDPIAPQHGCMKRGLHRALIVFVFGSVWWRHRQEDASPRRICPLVSFAGQSWTPTKRLSRARRRVGSVRRGALQESKSTQQEDDSKEPSIEERFNGFTRVLPWFGFAARALEEHVSRRARVRASTPCNFSFPLSTSSLANELADAIQEKPGSKPIADVVECALQAVEDRAKSASPSFKASLSEAVGRWEVVWSGALTPLQQKGLPSQSIWVEVTDKNTSVLTVHSGLPLGLFGAYLWTSAAGNIVEVDPVQENGAETVLIKLNRYWIDVGADPRPDIGRVDGGFINNRISAFAAALLTPVLLEFGLLKWLFEIIGFKRVFEVEVPSPSNDGTTLKLEASLDLYLTLLTMVAFPETLSTCPVPYLNVEAGLCIFEIPMLGPVGDLPDWLHPGGNAATLVAKRLGHEPGRVADK